MTWMYIVMFLLGITTAFAVVGVIALRDWYHRSNSKKANETEEDEDEELCLPPRPKKSKV